MLSWRPWRAASESALETHFRGAGKHVASGSLPALVPIHAVSAILECPVLAILECPLLGSSGEACRIQCCDVLGQARRLQAADGHRYGDHAAGRGGPRKRSAADAYAFARSSGRLRPTPPEVFLRPDTAPMEGATGAEGTAWGPPGEPDISGLQKSGHFRIAPTSSRFGLQIRSRRC